ncbi:A24 family peptidase [Cohnella pontilimi]|nr:prepilin peptidase [Cohnella pontilimi]
MDGMVLGVSSALLLSACWTDLKRLRIPNAITFGFACAGLAFHLLSDGWTGFRFSASGAAAGVLPLLLLYVLRGMGGGDVKWFGAFGAWAGALTALQLLFFSVLWAGGISVVLLLLRVPGIRHWGSQLPWPWGDHPVLAGRKAAFPFMLAVAPAFLSSLIFGGFQPQ